MKATASSVRISERRVRFVADAIRKMSITEALATLALMNRHGASALAKVIKSAVANAVTNNKMSADNLMIDTLIINQAPFLKRFRPSTRGRVHPFKKRASHITVTLKEVKNG